MKSKIVLTALATFMIMIATTTFAADKNNASTAKQTPVEKALSNFEKQFSASANPAVYTSGNSIIVRSEAGEHVVTAAYSPKGSWLYSITLYAKDNLARNIMEVVRENYINYYISGMEKIDQPGSNSVFIVHIKNNNSYKTVRVVNNDVELIEDITKA